MTLIDKARVIALVKEHLADGRRTYKGFGQAQEPLTFVESLLVPALAALPAQEDEVEKWKRAFVAQSQKLQSVLYIPGVKEELAVLAALPQVRDLLRRAYAAGWDAYHAQQKADWTDTRGVEVTREADLDAIAAAIREGRT